MSIKNPRYTLEQRRSLRRSMTKAESLFWNRVRKKQIQGIRFKRQYGVGPYILDFYVPKVNLCIEIDGGIHDLHEVKVKDANKDAFLQQNGISVLRFRNNEVENEMDEVIKIIEDEILKTLKK